MGSSLHICLIYLNLIFFYIYSPLSEYRVAVCPKSLKYCLPFHWNNFPTDIRQADSVEGPLSLHWLLEPHSRCFGSGSLSSRSLSSWLSLSFLLMCMLSLSPSPLYICFLSQVCVNGVLELCLLWVCAVCPLPRSPWWPQIKKKIALLCMSVCTLSAVCECMNCILILVCVCGCHSDGFWQRIYRHSWRVCVYICVFGGTVCREGCLSRVTHL